jgi:hypothetical protein
MRVSLTGLIVALLIGGCAPAAPDGEAEAAAPATLADADHPVVVELFQSQGCSSCPPANANLNRIADRPDIVALSFAVTYWDRLGWKDRFATPAHSERQWDYAHAANRSQVWTPQFIINGTDTIVGVRREQFDATIAAARGVTGGPAIEARDGAVTIAAAPAAAPATVWLVRYDPREQAVAISAGENDGRTLPHRNIVRSLDNLGSWDGDAVRFAVPADVHPALRTAILVQQGRGGPIIAARKW